MRTSLGVAAVSCALLLSGCAGVNLTTNTTETGAVPGVALQGRVHGGQNPISGAKVYLYSVSTSGYGNASTSLLNSPGYVTTSSSGGFTITSDYTCSANAQVYLYANGGNSGSGTNSAAGLLAGLGACSGLSSSTFIMVNEVSTIATAYALAGYATDATHISGSSNPLAATGIKNAFLAIPNLETLSTGVALATTPAANGGNGTAPQAEINTLANILAACVNSSGSVAAGQPCYTLFTNALSGGTTGTQPTDTATAAINIAHNPWANVAALFGLATASAPFQPMLPSVPTPNDWTMGIAYTGTSGAGYWNVAVDGSGNIWATNYNETYSLDQFKPTGAPATGSPFTGGGLDNPDDVAIDGSGNIWVTDPGLIGSYDNTISELNPSTGKWVVASGYSGVGGLDGSAGIAIDKSGDVWVTNEGNNSLSKLSSSGSPLSPSGGFTGSNQLSSPAGVAIDLSGHVWVANYGPDASPGESISEFNSDGSAVSGSPFTGGGLYEPTIIAIDAAGNVWASNDDYFGTPPEVGSLSEFSSAGVPAKNSPITGGGLNCPQGFAIDGAGNVWAANTQTLSVSEFSSTGTAITNSNGYAASGAFTGPLGLAIDGSGNVWVTNGEATGTYSAIITEMVGAASPVVTPIVANLLSPYGSAAVNKP